MSLYHIQSLYTVATYIVVLEEKMFFQHLVAVVLNHWCFVGFASRKFSILEILLLILLSLGKQRWRCKNQLEDLGPKWKGIIISRSCQ